MFPPIFSYRNIWVGDLFGAGVYLLLRALLLNACMFSWKYPIYYIPFSNQDSNTSALFVHCVDRRRGKDYESDATDLRNSDILCIPVENTSTLSGHEIWLIPCVNFEGERKHRNCEYSILCVSGVLRNQRMLLI